MALTITVNISDADEVVLKNDLLDIDDWVQKAVIGKIKNCKKRMIREWQPKLMADPTITTMPADEVAFVASVVTRPDYKDRVARDAAEAAARDGMV